MSLLISSVHNVTFDFMTKGDIPHEYSEEWSTAVCYIIQKQTRSLFYKCSSDSTLRNECVHCKHVCINNSEVSMDQQQQNSTDPTVLETLKVIISK